MVTDAQLSGEHLMHQPSVLKVTALCKTFGAVRAVDQVSFDVRRKEIVGLLGPNGAGKTTIINMLLGVLEPDGGSIRIQGYRLREERSSALTHTNFAAVYAPLPGNLTVQQNLRVFGRLYGVANLPERIETVLRQYEIGRFRDTKCGLLSSGEQTRVSLAKAMLNTPSLLLLDEPTASLDPSAAHDVRCRIRDFAAQGPGCVLWTSHNMYEVEEVCDRVLFLSRGRILLQGQPKTLLQEYGTHTLEELFIKVAREPLSLRHG